MLRPGTQPFELMRGIGNLCVGRDSDPRYNPRRCNSRRKSRATLAPSLAREA